MWFTRVRHPVFSVLKRGGFFEHLGAHHFEQTNDQALSKIMASLGTKHTHACHLINVKV